MFRKKITSEEIISGLMSFDAKIYKYLDAVYRPIVIKHVCKQYGEKEDGEELYQDIIFEIYLNVEQGKYNPELSKFSTYFNMKLKNRWIDKLRKKGRAIDTTSLEDSLLHNTLTNEEEIAEQDYYSKLVQAMRVCIGKLKEDEQEMIRLYYYSGMSLESVAIQLDMSSAKYAKQKLYLTRKKLKKLLSDYLGRSS